MTHPEFEAEASFIKAAYARLEDSKNQAKAMMDEVMDIGRGGTYQARTERDVIVRSALQRMEQLEIGDQALCFGRVDFNADSDQFAGLSFHLGRVAVTAYDSEPMIVDWRAPVAEPFYRATGKDPMGLRLRRHFDCEGPRLLGIEDEVLSGTGLSADGDEDLVAPSVSGAGALFAAIRKPRTAWMRDIVSTIQSEQDRIIRHPLPGLLVVQGGPGTGKTAVALHRAAYLLYTHKWRFETQGILVVGPNVSFLRYIERVLPSLGETGVELATIETVAGFGAAKRLDSLEVSAIKGDIRMVRFIAGAVRTRQRPLKRSVEIPFGSKYLILTPEVTRQAFNLARRRGGTHNSRRRLVEQFLAKSLVVSYLDDGPFVRNRTEQDNVFAISAGSETFETDNTTGANDVELMAEVTASLRRSVHFQRAVERVWPRLSPLQLLGDLYSHKPLFELAARGVLSEFETELLFEYVSTYRNDEVPRWSREDLALLDEARLLLGPVDKSEDDPPSYAHMVIDEAQDLSDMQARMLGRRCQSGSMTVLGDVAQAIGPFANRGWEQIVENLNGGKPFKKVELTVNYRTPSEAMKVASSVLVRYAPQLPPPSSLRSSGYPVELVSTEPEKLEAVVAARVKEELRLIEPGTVGVVLPAWLRGPVSLALTDLMAERGRVAVHDPESVKGLEFDSVIVVEPDRLLPDSDRAIRALFVALTRTTSRLTIVSTADLPSWLILEDS